MTGLRTRLLISIAIAAAVVLLAAGCGSDFWYDDYYYDDYDDTSPRKDLRIYLNVADQDGNPLQNATVWVDGTQQEDKTDDEYRELGNNFPNGWSGWEYNWRSGPLRFLVYDIDGSKRIKIIVSKSGWESQRTSIRVSRYDPDDIYMRQTFVMERSANPSATPKDAPLPPEVISSAQLAQ